MSINLQKGQKVDLSKAGSSISNLVVGLGWDMAGRGASIDCDASALMLSDQGKLISSGTIYFGNKRSNCGSVIHSGDNLTGKGDGDDEQIAVNLSKVPANVAKIVFVVNIYACESRRQDFGMIKNAFIRVFDKDNGTELCKFNLSDNYAGFTTLVTGEIYRRNDDWKFNALGEATVDTSVSEVANKYK